jgi:hypothetical protein
MSAVSKPLPALAPPAPVTDPRGEAPAVGQRDVPSGARGLAFAPSGGPLVAVCGLHGGAMTSTLAFLLAHAAAAESPGAVMLCETPAAAGDQARLTATSSRVSLAELAAAVAGGAPPARGWWAQRERLRVLATAPRPVPDLATGPAIAALLTRTQAAHALTVVDAGTPRDPATRDLLRAATHVIWTVALRDGAGQAARELLASPLVGALAARQLVAVRADRRPTAGAEGRELRRVADSHAERLLRVPHTDALAAHPPRAHDPAVRRLLTALARFLAAPCPT